MDIRKVKKLIELLEKSDLSEIALARILVGKKGFYFTNDLMSDLAKVHSKSPNKCYGIIFQAFFFR